MEKLAIEGGAKVRSQPFPPWPHFMSDEITAVGRVLESGRVNYWTGNEVKAFESGFAAFTRAKHCVAMFNGTVALEAALHAHGIGPGDEVVVTPRSFIASASCVVTRGATPVFADVDLNTGNIEAEGIEKVLTARTKAVIVVHLGGVPADMNKIMQLADSKKLIVIEDCAQAHGALVNGKPVGSIGHTGAYSFCQDKIMTTGGEGGAVVTNSDELWERLWSYKDHGKGYDTCYNKQHPPGFRWLHESIGTNFRMTEMQAAIGNVRLSVLPEELRRRKQIAQELLAELENFSCVRSPELPRHLERSYYKLYVYVKPAKLKAGWSRDRIMNAISAEGLPCLSGSCSEMYREKAFDRVLKEVPYCPQAIELGETSLMFLVHPTIDDESLADYKKAIRKVLSVASA